MDDFPEFETYADVIDAYERDNMGYATLTDYIKGENIKIKEIDISPLSDLKNMRDGGSVGIEVLFTEKVPAAPSQLVSESDILLGYRGDAAYRSGSAQASSIGQGNVGSKASFGGGKGVDRSGRSEGASGAVVSPKLEAQRQRNIIESTTPKGPNIIDKIVDNPLTKLLDPRSKVALAIGGYKLIRDGIPKLKDFEDEAIEDELENIKTVGGITPYADGGRVGLFMGGPALEGTALNIYNSMNAYGFSDQEIANALQERGLYTPGGSTPDPTPPQTSQRLGLQGDEQDVGYVDRQDYSFNKKNYEPGKQLEINPAAFGISFEKASKPQGIINQALKMPGRTLTSFASPTTGGNITGPAEEGFMSQVVDIDPAKRTREQLRQQYDSYNRFFGAPSNYAAARTPGKVAQVFGTIAGAAAGVPFLGAGLDALGKMTNRDKSDTSLYAVDNVGFGQGTQRDEFGVYTGGKTGFGTTTSYGERMANRLGELSDFFGSRIEGFDINNIDADMLSEMSKINSVYAKQVQAYQQRLQRERINKAQEDREKAEEIAKQEQEAAFQAQLNETQRQQRMDDLQRIERAYREDTGGRGGSYATGESGVQADGSYNDPFDPGGGEKDGGFIDGYNRRKYSDGGVATMFRNKR
jgi:hypothetical protein